MLTTPEPVIDIHHKWAERRVEEPSTADTIMESPSPLNLFDSGFDSAIEMDSPRKICPVAGESVSNPAMAPQSMVMDSAPGISQWQVPRLVELRQKWLRELDWIDKQIEAHEYRTSVAQQQQSEVVQQPEITFIQQQQHPQLRSKSVEILQKYPCADVRQRAIAEGLDKMMEPDLRGEFSAEPSKKRKRPDGEKGYKSAKKSDGRKRTRKCHCCRRRKCKCEAGPNNKMCLICQQQGKQCVYSSDEGTTKDNGKMEEERTVEKDEAIADEETLLGGQV